MRKTPDETNLSNEDIIKKVRESLEKKNRVIQDLRNRQSELEKALEDAKRELIRAKELADSHDRMMETLENILSEDPTRNDPKGNG